jgi:importin subunit beta-1
LVKVDVLILVSEAGFSRYLESFKPFLIAGLQNHEEHQMCSIAIGLVGDISRALNEGVAPYCDEIMTYLLQHLQNPSVHRTIKPAVLSCFGDIALAIGGHFETYLQATMTTLFQVHSGISGVEPVWFS